MDNNFLRVHSFESFGTVDGPGIRYIIFLQGCSLRCKYCQNRDTWDINSGQIISINEITDRILNYKNYICPSGGVTVSGGEPILQVKSLINLFKRLKKHCIHTAIDTSGIFDLTEDVKELLKYTDLVLLDIKHIDSEKCKELVGFRNEKELKFAHYLSDNNIDMWIRQVLIPGITDDEKDLLKLKSFVSSLNTVKKLEILPYHTMGKYKWADLGFSYDLEKIPDATSEDVKRAKNILRIRLNLIRLLIHIYLYSPFLLEYRQLLYFLLLYHSTQ